MVKEVIFELSLKKSNPHFPTWELPRGPERPNISKIYYNHHAPSLSFFASFLKMRGEQDLSGNVCFALSLSQATATDMRIKASPTHLSFCPVQSYC